MGVIYRQVVQDIFEPIIEDILRLVDAQVKKALSKRSGQGLKVCVLQSVNTTNDPEVDPRLIMCREFSWLGASDRAAT